MTLSFQPALLLPPLFDDNFPAAMHATASSDQEFHYMGGGEAFESHHYAGVQQNVSSFLLGVTLRPLTWKAAPQSRPSLRAAPDGPVRPPGPWPTRRMVA